MGIAIIIDEESSYTADFKISETGFEIDDGLETSVLISLFSDARASEEQLPPEQTFKRGYWGDMFSPKNGDKHGSLLWLYEREKQTVDFLSKIEDTARQSLQWFIDDGIAKEISIRASHPRHEFTLLEISITKPDGKIHAFRILWDGQRLKRA